MGCRSRKNYRQLFLLYRGRELLNPALLILKGTLQGVPQTVKKLFDSLVDGGASSPATATPTRFHLNPSDSGREICKEAIFSPGNGISLRKNQLRARRTRRRARFLWLFCVGFSTN